MKLASVVAVLVALSACRPRSIPEEAAMKMKAPAKEAFVLSDEEWRKKLTPEQYEICRQKGTERPYTGEYLHLFKPGTYDCVACGQPLYTSETKYDACGWPSFWDALAGAVRTESGREAVCSRCGSHLGHVFDDGPPPTGKRH